jgi:sugar lactone lactonase YvrE
MEYTPTVLLDGFVFTECPRWHGGAFWFCDVNGKKLITLAADGAPRVVLEHEQQPGGLGWTPDGTLLFVSMLDRRLMRAREDGVPEAIADFSADEPVSLNDMVVDGQGRAYIGGFGFDLNRGAPPVPGNVYVVHPDGKAGIAAGEMMFPNGMIVTPDGRTLIVAETVARRLTAFDVADDGLLSGRRVWATLDAFPDGICLDAEGAVWVRSPPTGQFLRVREGGEVLDTITVKPKWAVACMLGGVDGRTLYLCTAETTLQALADGTSKAWIETARVDIGAPV